MICFPSPAIPVEGEVHIEVTNDVGADQPVWSDSQQIFAFVQLVDADIRLSLYTEVETEAAAVVRVSSLISTLSDDLQHIERADMPSQRRSTPFFAWHPYQEVGCPQGYPDSCRSNTLEQVHIKSPYLSSAGAAIVCQGGSLASDPQVTVTVLHGTAVLAQDVPVIADNATINLVPFSLSSSALQPPFNDTLTVRVTATAGCRAGHDLDGANSGPASVSIERPVRLVREVHRDNQVRVDRYTKLYSVGPDWRNQKVGHAWITSGHNKSDLRPYQT